MFGLSAPLDPRRPRELGRRPDSVAAVIEEILPAGVACAEAFTDRLDVALFPEEEALIAKAVVKRRREFTTGRDCARTALAALGVPPAPILPGERGAPQWPQGYAGSITHCAGYRAAAVASTREVLAIGVDAEPDEVLPDGVLDHVTLPGERARLRDLAAAAPGTSWDRLLFSAKESVYKAWFPATRQWLGFEGADITIDPVQRRRGGHGPAQRRDSGHGLSPQLRP